MALHVIHVMGGEQHRDLVFAVQLAHEVANGEFRDGIQPDRRFVEKQQARSVQQRRGQVGTHTLAERELAHRHVEHWFKVHERDQTVAVVAVCLRRDAIDVAQEVEALDHRQVPPKLGALAEDDADAADVTLPVTPRGQAIHLARSTRGVQDSGEDLDGGRLPRSVGTDIAHKFAAFDVEVDTVQGADFARPSVDQSPKRPGESRQPFGHAE